MPWWHCFLSYFFVTHLKIMWKEKEKRAFNTLKKTLALNPLMDASEHG
jgi:hypothetical protein